MPNFFTSSIFFAPLTLPSKCPQIVSEHVHVYFLPVVLKLDVRKAKHIPLHQNYWLWLMILTSAKCYNIEEYLHLLFNKLYFLSNVNF